MAEGGNDKSNWWGSWIDSAKSKSVSMLEAVKKDLEELSTTVKTEASNLADSLKIDEYDSTAKNVKKSISSFFEQVTDALNPQIEDDDAEAILITNDGSLTLTGFTKHLMELQTNDDTYLLEPSPELLGKYKRWLEIIEQDQFTETRLSKHLSASTILNEKYVELVPKKVSFMDFWKRYLFKKALLEDALANAEKAERKSTIEAAATSGMDVIDNVQTIQPISSIGKIIKEVETAEEADINWVHDEFITAPVELSEDEQARLLAEYEQEIQERDKINTKAQSINTVPIIKTKETKPQQSTNNKTSSKNVKTRSKQQQQPIQKIDKTKQKLNIENNHFKKDDKEENSSSTSDESWEKVYDTDDTINKV